MSISRLIMTVYQKNNKTDSNGTIINYQLQVHKTPSAGTVYGKKVGRRQSRYISDCKENLKEGQVSLLREDRVLTTSLIDQLIKIRNELVGKSYIDR